MILCSDLAGLELDRRRGHSTPIVDRLQLARDVYQAFASADRDFIESVFADDFTFSSPVDVGLDRSGYFERSWPGAGRGQEFDFVRLVKDARIAPLRGQRHPAHQTAPDLLAPAIRGFVTGVRVVASRRDVVPRAVVASSR